MIEFLSIFNFVTVFVAQVASKEIHVDKSAVSRLIAAFNSSNLNENCFYKECISSINEANCDALCNTNIDFYEALILQISSCFNRPLCGLDMVNLTIHNLDELLVISGYNGVCTLHADRVTVTGITKMNVIVEEQSSRITNSPSYKNIVSINLKWSGLSITCKSPNSTPKQSRVAENTTTTLPRQPESVDVLKHLRMKLCPASEILTQMGIIDLLFLGCVPNDVKPKVNEPSYESPVTITQTVHISFVLNFSHLSLPNTFQSYLKFQYRLHYSRFRHHSPYPQFKNEPHFPRHFKKSIHKSHHNHPNHHKHHVLNEKQIATEIFISNSSLISADVDFQKQFPPAMAQRLKTSIIEIMASNAFRTCYEIIISDLYYIMFKAAAESTCKVCLNL